MFCEIWSTESSHMWCNSVSYVPVDLIAIYKVISVKIRYSRCWSYGVLYVNKTHGVIAMCKLVRNSSITDTAHEYIFVLNINIVVQVIRKNRDYVY